MIRVILRRLVSAAFLASVALILTMNPPVAFAAAGLPLVFEANRGQAGGSHEFVSRADGYEVLLDPAGAVLVLPSSPSAPAERLRLLLLDAQPQAWLEGSDELPGKVAYLTGSDPAAWLSRIPTYAAVTEGGLYPGVTLTYRGDRRHLEIELALAPGSDPRAIRLGIDGANAPRIDDSSGDLVLRAGGGEIRLLRPTARQMIRGEVVASAASFVLRGVNEVGVLTSALDPEAPLRLAIRVSRTLARGPIGTGDAVRIATDAKGNAYVAGRLRTRIGEPANAFVAKLSPDGSTRLYTVYFGGEGDDTPMGIAVDSAGQALVTGWTTSREFPVVAPLEPALRGPSDAFVSKLDAEGASFIYSTYLGGDGADQGLAVDVDADGAAWVTGRTVGGEFPTTETAAQGRPGGRSDAFVASLGADGSQLLYSTYLGGSGDEAGAAIRVDRAGGVHVAGSTRSVDFPVVNALQAAPGGAGHSPAGDAFVAKLDRGGERVLFATYLGGSVVAADSR
ncbi:MAG: SBBP repeat-containing protein [Acidobacteriia bacterium]|nr:SBBP repeat-containing protein [Terriglobia bacterium]